MRLSSLSLLLIISLFSCKNESSSFDFGQMNDSTYNNSFFDFAMEVPSSTFQSTTNGKDAFIFSKGLPDVKPSDSESVEFQPNEVDNAQLLIVQKLKPQKDVLVNANLVIMADNLSDDNPPFKDALDYVQKSKKTLEGSGIFKFEDGEIQEETINGKTFYALEGTLDANGIPIKQISYTTFSNGFALNSSIIYNDESEKEAFLDVFRTIRFN